MNGGVSPARLDAVTRAAKQWTDQLIDIGGNNRLLFYRPLKVGTLDLTAVAEQLDPERLDALRAGSPIRLAHLFPDESHRLVAASKLRAIASKARENEEERGIATLFLAWGMATWTPAAPHSPRPNAPVFLLPLSANRRSTAGDDFDLRVEGETELNPILVHVLSLELGVHVDVDAVLKIAGARDAPLDDPDAGIRELRDVCREVPGFQVDAHVVIGNFSFAKLPMVKDIQQNTDALARHAIIAALAGDADAQGELRAQIANVEPSLPDRTPPADEFLILDADSSQNHAINRVLAGESLVVQGPPGTGKSQTIANLVAAAVGHGKRVLFVAEKRAAIDAVMGRLDRQGLKSLVLDLHSKTSSRQEIVRALGAAMEAAGAITEPDLADLHHALTKSRSALVAHDEALHRRRAPWEISIHQIVTDLSEVPQDLRSEIRLAPTVLGTISRQALEDAANDLHEHVTVRRADGPGGAGSWVGAPFTSIDECRTAHRAVTEALAAWQRLAPDIDRAAGEIAATRPVTMEQLATLVELCRAAQDLIQHLRPEALNDPRLEKVAQGLATGTGFLSRRKAPYKQAKATVLSMAAPGIEDIRVLTGAVDDAVALPARWSASFGPVPVRVPSGTASLIEGADAFRAALMAAQPFLAMGVIDGDVYVIVDRLRQLAATSETLFRQPRLREIEASFRHRGLGAVIDEAVASDLSPERAVLLLRHTWLRSIYDIEAPTDFGAFSGALMDDRVRTFQESDKDHLERTALRVRRVVAARAVAARDRHPDQSQFLVNQVHRKRGIKPIRELFRMAPDVMLSLKPCWTMSPLLVAQMLPGDRQYFDLVIFDEASQVAPADAVPAILRAPQLVVAGDSRQLPPTAFFATETASDHEDDDADDEIDLSVTTGFESVLDATATLLRPAYLDWHYRSRDERLIAFSNAHIYDNRLTTFPGVAADRCLTHVLVDPAVPNAEADAVTSLVLEHARRRPRESLGVIAMGIKHAELVNEAVRAAVAASPDKAELDEFFSESADERFFVKNLERVQGDERDAIILTTGYGPGPDGRMRYSFGPLNQEGGERRLNVAISRARTRMAMVSTFRSSDLDPARTQAKGADLLRRFLRYVESQGNALDLGGAVPVELNSFEIEVRDALQRRGVPLHPQYGVSGYRLDFAAAHPDRPGQMVLAIECDGASYHSSHTARDRDRLRQAVLENLGWRFHRIWSTDWFRDPVGCTDSVIEVWREAVRRSDLAETQMPIEAEVDADERGPVASTAHPTRSGPKPVRGDGRPITEYQPRQLDALIRWIKSDTLLRTRDELVAEAIAELGFKRRGARIVSAIEAAIDSVG